MSKSYFYKANARTYYMLYVKCRKPIYGVCALRFARLYLASKCKETTLRREFDTNETITYVIKEVA